jgi:PAS domain S-box-containing protein
MKKTFESTTTDVVSTVAPDEELMARIEQLELVIQATDEGLWDWNIVTDEVYFSPRWKAMLGYADEEFPNSTDEWQRRVHPDDVEEAVGAIRGYVAGEWDNCENVHRLRHRDGSYRWMYTRGALKRDGEGRPVRLVGSHADITSRKQAEEDLRRRDAILEAVRFAAERFLNAAASWEESVQDVLERLARATEVSRTYVFENYVGDDGEIWNTLTHEWSAPGAGHWIDNPTYKALSLKGVGLGRWKETLERGEMLYGHVRELPDSERPQAEGQGPLSFVSVPIFVDGTWWGVIGFDECTHERDFSAPERDALKSAADLLGAAIGRKRAEERSARLAAIVESTHDAIVGMLRNGTITSWNRGAEILYGYTAEEMIGRSIRPLMPLEELPRLRDVLIRLTAGERLDHFETEFIKKDKTHVTVSMSFSLVRDPEGGVTGASAIARDISEQKRAESELRESQRSLSTLLSNLPGMAYRCLNRPDWPMDFISEGSLDLTGYSAAELTGNARVTYADLIHPDDRERVWRDVQDAIDLGQPFRMNYRISTADGAEKWVLEQGRGVTDDRDHVQAIEGIIIDVTDRVQARRELERRVEERTHELATVLNVSSSIASTLELETLLGVILEQFEQVVPHTAASISFLENEMTLRLLDYRGPMDQGDLVCVWPSHENEHSWEVIRSAKPVIIPDVRADTPLAQAFQRKAVYDTGGVPIYISSWMGVPLIFRDKVIGLLAVDSNDLDAYTSRDAELALAFATHAAVAIENAQLYEQAQGKAALEERHRLARELHDSVSQALFGIGLGARTARTLLDVDPGKAVAPLEYVLSLAEAGLTEMRALIFELRPEALEQEGLVAALEKQVATLRTRHGLEVTAEFDHGAGAAGSVEEAVYRIAQEALNNITKHAQASKVHVRLGREMGRIVLSVADNGAGFDPSASYSGHLGLKSMRERAERLGGSLQIESAPGAGSRLEVAIPA